MKFDYTLYLVTDRKALSGRPLEAAVAEAVSGGCTMVQFREKGIPAVEFYRRAVSLKRVTDRLGVPLIINNSVETALAVKAAGVHIGQNDLPAAPVRRLLPREMLLGVSVSTEEEAERAAAAGADYLGVGAMFPTSTKPDAELVSMETLARICRKAACPVVAIGGINRENASAFRAAGAAGLAVVSAILARPDIKEAATELKRAFSGRPPPCEDKGNPHGMALRGKFSSVPSCVFS